MAVSKKKSKKKAPVSTNAAPELNNMPPVDPEVQAARRYLNAIGEVQTAEESRDTAAGEFITIMKDKNRDKITVDGNILIVKHVPGKDAEDKLVVKKPKTTVTA